MDASSSAHPARSPHLQLADRDPCHSRALRFLSYFPGPWNGQKWKSAALAPPPIPVMGVGPLFLLPTSSVSLYHDVAFFAQTNSRQIISWGGLVRDTKEEGRTRGFGTVGLDWTFSLLCMGLAFPFLGEHGGIGMACSRRETDVALARFEASVNTAPYSSPANSPLYDAASPSILVTSNTNLTP